MTEPEKPTPTARPEASHAVTRQRVFFALALANLVGVATLLVVVTPWREIRSESVPTLSSSRATPGQNPRDRARIEAYLAAPGPHKLQVGAGRNNFPGWLNTDIEPIEGQAYLDATKRFPVPDGSFEYVYAEQLIEHLPYADGVFFLGECLRVLKPGGRLRLATPNLLRLVALFNQEKTPIQQKLMDYQIRAYGLSHTVSPETVTLNLFFRAWGHQFLYDPKSLRATLEKAGFRAITEHPLGVSDAPELNDIEMHWKTGGRELDEYTSMFLEAERP